MGEKTGIEWADSTANLWMGCTKISPACDNCYAERDFAEFHKMVEWGPHGDRRYVKAGWSLIEKMNRKAAKNNGVDPELGRKRRIFVNSLSDFFDNHKSILPEWRKRAFEIFEACDNVIIMLVTKRPENIAKMVPSHWMERWPDHVWLMVTTEDQIRADHRCSILKTIPAKVKAVSVEPMLGPVDLAEWLPWGCTAPHCPCKTESECMEHGINWVVIGGESGPNARPTNPAWVYALVEQCRQANVPVVFKQWGEWFPYGGIDAEGHQNSRTMGEKPGVWHQWPDGEGFSVRIGKKQAGRYVDGELLDGYPKD